MAREGMEFEPMTKEVEIYRLEKLEEREISARKFLAEISRKIDLVKGDFRQEEIKTVWQNLLENSSEKFDIVKMKISCSSGTYVRSIANEMGGLAYSIKRTRVGDMSCKMPLRS
jgi:tRNA U55 pseudouridine synthase TruB